MPWIRARLRGQLIYAKADEQGKPLATGGRVEVRYKTNDGRKYQAAVGNLVIEDGTPLPEDTCGDAEAPAPKAEGAGADANKPRATGKHAALPQKTGPDALIAYTDGACTGNPGPAGLGVVIPNGDKPPIELSEYLGQGTNNIAELTAILRAVQLTTGEVRIHTDSQYSIGVLGRGWKAKANVELIATIKQALKGRTIDLIYVKGHAGIPLNERADELARLAIVNRGTIKTGA